MKIKLYNTPSRKIEEFKPIKTGEVGIYSCGPTVYWNQHIGHMYAYVQWDALVRLFCYLGFKTKWAMNITDVGHMTSDEDAGEDKMEVGAKREKVSVWKIADKYIKQFLESLEFLNITQPDVLSRATEHIQEQIDLIKKIEANGFAYKTKTGLVFDTSKFKDYAKFANLDFKKQKPGARVEVDPEKKKPWDFLLWVTNQSKHIMQWKSPWGRGFPGWHAECTAMSVKYLGTKFDIHTGGIEHIPVHHTNEVAQGFGAYGQQTANFWLHNAWLVIKDKKMSKSLGNMYLVTDLIKKGYDPMAFRYLILTSHYRKGLNFTWKGLDSASAALGTLREIFRGLPSQGRKRLSLSQVDLAKTEDYRKRFLEALTNDLGTPEALAVAWKVAKSNVPARDKYELLLDWDQVLGLKLGETPKAENPEEVEKLVEKREELRKGKKWQEADEVRKKIEKLGWQIEDTSQGPKLKKKNQKL